MFSDNWLLLTLLLFIFSAVLEHGELLLIAVLLTTVTLMAWLWNRFVLRQVEYTREFTASRAFPGERVKVSVALTNRKLLPVPWLRVDDAFPESLAFVDRSTDIDEQFQGPELLNISGRTYLIHLASLGPRERVRWTYEIECPQRGFYFFGPTEIQSGDIFGFFAQGQHLRMPGRLIVYPRVQPLPELGFPGKDPFGEKKTFRHIVEDPTRTVGVREYHPEDAIKRVHWKASARQGELQVKVYEPIITQQLVVFLNMASFAQTWMGIIPERQEQAISVAASIAFHATERRFAVGLIANGSVPHSDQPIKVLPGRAPDQLTRVLEALAAVTGFVTTDIEKLLAAESPRLALGATLVVITTVVTDNLLAQMLRLRDAGRRLTLVSMDPEFQTEELPGITTHHVPLAEVDFAGVWSKATTAEAKMPQGDDRQVQGRRREQ
jgi:uncharacterized protein (DUF58 family)